MSQTIQNKLRETRKANKIKVDRIVAICRVSRITVYAWERGDKVPHRTRYARIEEAYGRPIHELLPHLETPPLFKEGEA